IAAINASNGKLAGHLGAETFNLDHADYINGVLKFVDTVHQQDISLFLGVDASQLPDQWARYIEPSQLGVTVQIARAGGEIQSFNSGYKLSLRLNKMAENKVAGNIELLFSDQRRSFIVGTFEAVTSQVQYRGGEIDRTLENEDTVFYVIKDYLKKNFPEQISQVTSVANLQRRYENGVQRATASTVVKMSDGEEHRFDIVAVKRESGWEVSENNSTQLLAAVSAMQKSAPASGKPQLNAEPKPLDLARDVFLPRANTYLGRWVEVELVGGTVQKGVLAAVDANTLSLRPATAGMDKALLSVRRDNILRVRIPIEK
ncbi:MAG TPA: hypothetical protein VFM46_07840, partial [Pseudomonadales bacterium]|nr:hypothetical protein [Pseudomonadales bacterium]